MSEQEEKALAFDIMIKRGWIPRKDERGVWWIDTGIQSTTPPIEELDPLTVIKEGDKWAKAQEERAKKKAKFRKNTSA